MPDPTAKCGACGRDVPPRGAFHPVGDVGHDILCFACIFVFSLNGATCGTCGSAPCMGFVATQQQDGGRIEPMAMCPVCLSTCQEHVDDVVVEGHEAGRGRLPIPESTSEN